MCTVYVYSSHVLLYSCTWVLRVDRDIFSDILLLAMPLISSARTTYRKLSFICILMHIFFVIISSQEYIENTRKIIDDDVFWMWVVKDEIEECLMYRNLFVHRWYDVKYFI